MDDLGERIKAALLDCVASYYEEIDFEKAADAVLAILREQEPVAWAATDEDGKIEALGFNQSRRRFDTPLYAAPMPPSVPDIAKRMAELNRRLREPEWHFESIREFQRELTVLEGMALAAAPKPGDE